MIKALLSVIITGIVLGGMMVKSKPAWIIIVAYLLGYFQALILPM